MTPVELVAGFRAGRRNVTLLPFEGCPAERGVILGSDSVDDDDAISDAKLIDDDVWVVEVVEDDRTDRTDDGLRGGVPAEQMIWRD